MTDHANELRRHARKIPHPQGETPGVMLRAADEIERLRAKIEAMERQEPVAWRRERDEHRRRKLSFEKPVKSSPDKLHWSPLYAIPGAQAQPAPSVPDGVIERLAALPARITPEQAPDGVRDYCHESAEGYADGWNACIKAMTEKP